MAKFGHIGKAPGKEYCFPLAMNKSLPINRSAINYEDTELRTSVTLTHATTM